MRTRWSGSAWGVVRSTWTMTSRRSSSCTPFVGNIRRITTLFNQGTRFEGSAFRFFRKAGINAARETISDLLQSGNMGRGGETVHAQVAILRIRVVSKRDRVATRLTGD